MGKVKEIWNNRKTRGIIFLILYVILFSYIFIVYGNKSEKIILPENRPLKEEKKVVSNYKYQYILGDEIFDIVKNKDILYLKKGDLEYYYLNGKYYKLDEKLKEIEAPLKYNFDYYNKLEDIKKISTLVKTTTYADGKIEENYDVNLAEFLSLFGVQEEVDAKEMLNYSIIIVNKEIDEINFSIGFKIKYQDFKNVPEINTNYEIDESENE